MMNYRTGENPAIALYKFWLSIIRATNPPHEQDRSVPFLVDRYGIATAGQDERGRPILAFGWLMGGRGVHSMFEVTANGHFRIAGTMHGTHRRNILARATFLEWGYRAQRYQWYVNTTNAYRELWRWSHDSFSNWNDPIWYYSEDLLGCRSWRQTSTWVALERRGAQWRMVPTRLHGQEDVHDSLTARFASYEQLTKRRYLAHENHHRTSHGLEPKKSVRAITVRAGGQVLDQEEAVKRLVALLDPSLPAVSPQPLPRPKEAV